MGPPLILAYHGLAEVSRAADPTGLMVPPGRFREHVRRLRGRGYEFVPQAEFARRLHESGPPRGVCSLTFDDGTQDNLDVLPGVLEELDVPATVFVCPDLMGRAYPWLPGETGIRLMDRQGVRDLSGLPGVEIGSHTLDHTLLDTAGPEEARRQMRDSKVAIEDLIGLEVASFSYPKGLYSEACLPAAREVGYLSAVTTGPRGSWDPYELRRESPDPLDGRLAFELKVRGRYYGARSSLPGRLIRSATRPLRHRGAGR